LLNWRFGICRSPAAGGNLGIKLLIPKINLQPRELTMRQERTIQGSIFDLFAGHEIGRELKVMSDWLDQHPGSRGWWRKI